MKSKSAQVIPAQSNNSQSKPQLSPVTIFLTLMLCMILMGIDFLGIGVALPLMSKYFNVSADSTHWLVTLFAVGYVSFIITASRLADIYGRRKIFIISVFLFALSSLLVGAAINFTMALLGRFLQGVSAGAMIMVVVAIISDMFTGADRKNKTSTLIAMFGLGTGIGPLVGGFLVDILSWRYLFLINIPVALLVCVVARLKLPESSMPNKKLCLDIPGMILLTTALSAFALVISQAPSWGEESTKALLTHAIWVIALIAFIVVESKASNPLIKMKLFRTENFLVANIIGIIVYVCLSSWIICSGLYFSLAMHYSAFNVGLTYLPFGVSLVLTNLFMPSLNKKFNTKKLVLCAVIIGVISFLWMAYAAGSTAGIMLYSVGTLLFGISFVIINSLSVPLGLEFFKSEEMNIGAGVAMMLRWVGAAIGPPVLSSIFTKVSASSNYGNGLAHSYVVLAIILGVVFMISMFFIKQKNI